MKNKSLSKIEMALILAGLMASLFMSALDSTIVGTAMKRIVNDLQGMELYAWPFTIYMLCSTVITPISGGLSDIFGRKPVFLTGIFIFLIGSTLCGTSQNMVQLILYRGIQGIGGGVIITSVFTLVADLYAPEKRGKYMGIVTSMFALASIIGPLLGGFITDNLSWRWVFYINIPVGLIALGFVFFVMPDYKSDASSTSQRKSVDYKGTVTLVLALVPMLLAFSWAGTAYSWGSLQIIGMFVFSAVMLVLFIYFETKSTNPMIPISFFKTRSISSTLAVAFLTNAVMISAIMYIPYFVQGIMGSSATTSGVVTIPMTIGVLTTSTLTGILTSKSCKFKPYVFASFILMAFGSILLATLRADTSYLIVSVSMIILGLGVGISMPIGTTNVQNAVHPSQLSAATSTVQFFRNIGSTIASAIFGTIMASSMSRGFNKLDLSAIPDSIQSVFMDPQILTDNNAVNQILQQAPKENVDAYTEVLTQAKNVLAGSIQEIFFFCMITSIVGIAVAFLFKSAPIGHAGDHRLPDRQ